MFSIMNMECFTLVGFIFLIEEKTEKGKKGRAEGRDGEERNTQKKRRKGEHKGEKKKGGEEEEKIQGK